MLPHIVSELETRVLAEENITSLHTFQISELQMDYSNLETRLGNVEETQNGIIIFVHVSFPLIRLLYSYMQTLILLPRSFGQGNVFTPVCHSDPMGVGWLPSMHHRSHD